MMHHHAARADYPVDDQPQFHGVAVMARRLRVFAWSVMAVCVAIGAIAAEVVL